MAGFQNSTGDVVIPMDGDGQNDPTDIPRLLDKLAEGFNIVSGWRQTRHDRALTRRLPSLVANRLISAVLHVRLHDYGCTLKAYRREVVEDVPPIRRDASLHPDLCRVGGGARHRDPGRPSPAPLRQIEIRPRPGGRGSCWTC